MKQTEIKKQSLINFISWKLRSETQEDYNRIMEQCKKMSYRALHQWAVNNDFIDY